MIDHISIQVADYDKARAFYEKALAPLGYKTMMEYTREQVPEMASPKVGGLGAEQPDFWLAQSTTPSTPQHLAFRAKSRADVDAFYKAALAAGAKDNGPPGVRAQYHPNYYGAFVIDVGGHNLEACCHDPA
jgi:catechol 2,3-dioxygenase-like lactoylglutathione lyase family enzyme